MNKTKEEIQNAVDQSVSLAQVLRILGYKTAQPNYRGLNKKLKDYNIDTSNLLGQAHNAGKNFGPKKDIQLYLNNEIKASSNWLKKRLIKEGFLAHKCSKCNRTEWEEQPIPVQLDHIDGNHNNNDLSNLRILCPNCHAQTDNYCGKNKKSKYIRKNRDYKTTSCPECNNKKHRQAKLCKKCNDAKGKTSQRRSVRPSKEELQELIKIHSFCELGRIYKVSDNAIRKWCKFYNLPCNKKDII